MELNENSKFLDTKTLTELQYLQQLVAEAIQRKKELINPLPVLCTCKGFYKNPHCPKHS